MKHNIALFYGILVVLVMVAGGCSVQGGERTGELVMDSLESTHRMMLNVPVKLDKAYLIARKKMVEETGKDWEFNAVFSKGERYYFFACILPDKIGGRPIKEHGVYVDGMTGEAQYVDSKRTYARPAYRHEYVRGNLNGQLEMLNHIYREQSHPTEPQNG